MEIINYTNDLKTWYRNLARHYNHCIRLSVLWHRIVINLHSPRVVHITAIQKYVNYVL